MTKDHRSKWIGNDRGADLAAFESCNLGFTSLAVWGHLVVARACRGAWFGARSCRTSISGGNGRSPPRTIQRDISRIAVQPWTCSFGSRRQVRRSSGSIPFASPHIGISRQLKNQERFTRNDQ